jgi:3',5'-cyclic AMP phosphodiesterase CpdA
MRFAIINDMHIGPADSGFAKGVQRKLTSESERLVKKFVNEMNATENPEFVVCLGDLIEDVNNREVDIDSFRKAIGLLKPLRMPLYCLVGNHDVRTLSQNEIAKMLGHNRMYYSYDHGDYHFVALSFEMTGRHTEDVIDIRAEVPPHQIDWLKADLGRTKKPTVIFIHYPLPEDDLVGNFWFNGETKHALIGNRAEIRKLLEEAGNVKAVISAHQHWNRMHVHNGIPYFTVTSLVENFNNDGVPSEAYTLVNLDESGINVNVTGNDPATFNFSFRK